MWSARTKVFILLCIVGCFATSNRLAAQGGPGPTDDLSIFALESAPFAQVGLPFSGFKTKATGGTPAYTFSLSLAPDWVELDTSDIDNAIVEVGGTPPEVGTFTIRITVSDQTGATSKVSHVLTVYSHSELKITTTGGAAGANGAPALPPVPVTTPSSVYSTTIEIIGGDTSQDYTWEIPTNTNGVIDAWGLSFEDGVLSGAAVEPGPVQLWPVQLPFTVTVSDLSEPKPQVVTKEFTLILTSKFFIQTSGKLPQAIEGKAYTGGALTALLGTEPYTWQLSKGELPPGLSLDSVTGVISGTPTPGQVPADQSQETYTFGIEVTDAAVPTLVAEEEIVLKVSRALSATIPSLPAGTDGLEYLMTDGSSVAFTLSDGVPSYQLAITEGAFPPGLFLQHSKNNTYVVIGSIEQGASEESPYLVTLTASDSSEPASEVEMELEIVVTPALISSATFPEYGYIDKAIVPVEIFLANGQAPFTITSQTVAPGLGVVKNSDPAIFIFDGTPTDSGSYDSIITITDSTLPHSQSTTLRFKMEVYLPPLILTEHLPVGLASSSYEVELNAIGGNMEEPYLWSVEDLPTGLELENPSDTATKGRIKGTPQSQGAAVITLTLKDVYGEGMLTKLSLMITQESVPPLSITNTYLPVATAGATYKDVLLAAQGGTPSYEWQAGGLPSGLSVVETGEGWYLGGTLPSGTIGSYPIQLVVRDSDGLRSGAILNLLVLPDSEHGPQDDVQALGEAQSFLLAGAPAAAGCSLMQGEHAFFLWLALLTGLYSAGVLRRP